MTIKIKSTVKELMSRKGIKIPELSKKTGLPHIAIVNACSERIEFSGLNILSKIALVLDVSIKDLFEEKNLSKNKPVAQKTTTCGTNISSVTEQLISTIMKMKANDKDKLVEKYNELKKSPSPLSDVSNVTSHLVDLIMTMTLEERCSLLGDFISFSGNTKRKYGRQDYFRPIPFTANEKLYHGSTKNISMGGVYIDISNSKNLFAVGDELKMNLEHPQTFQHLNIDGTIVRIVKSGIGVKFKKEI
jgi:PilZ domain-containing protein/Cro/C1-type helix-turn-helix DNA-binding protein